MEAAVLQGRNARFGSGWVIERQRLLDLIDRIRAAVPAEVEDARGVLEDRQTILEGAGEEAQILLTKARQEAELRVNSHDLTLEAQRRAAEIVEQATEQARMMTEQARNEAAAVRGEATSHAVEQAREADRYSLDVLRRLEAQLAALETSVRAGISQLDQKIEREGEQLLVDARDAEIREGRLAR
ncbi:MAG: hypothetical protein V3V06_01360 [Dehalococcoidia bacterium]